jgi:hypothetical protein
MTHPDYRSSAHSPAFATDDTCIPKAEFCDARDTCATATDRPGFKRLMEEARHTQPGIVFVEDMDRVCQRGRASLSQPLGDIVKHRIYAGVITYPGFASGCFVWFVRLLRTTFGLRR